MAAIIPGEVEMELVKSLLLGVSNQLQEVIQRLDLALFSAEQGTEHSHYIRQTAHSMRDLQIRLLKVNATLDDLIERASPIYHRLYGFVPIEQPALLFDIIRHRPYPLE
jgi:hypothetical protein